MRRLPKEIYIQQSKLGTDDNKPSPRDGSSRE
jgi:hypothetical protein